jgi:hypothetical protein
MKITLKAPEYWQNFSRHHDEILKQLEEEPITAHADTLYFDSDGKRIAEPQTVRERFSK